MHEVLCGALGSGQVYFQPPESVKMRYPAIVYSLDGIDRRDANDAAYILARSYEAVVVDRDPDSAAAERVALLPRSRFVRSYASDGLNHFVFKITF